MKKKVFTVKYSKEGSRSAVKMSFQTENADFFALFKCGFKLLIVYTVYEFCHATSLTHFFSFFSGGTLNVSRLLY